METSSEIGPASIRSEHLFPSQQTVVSGGRRYEWVKHAFAEKRGRARDTLNAVKDLLQKSPSLTVPELERQEEYLHILKERVLAHVRKDSTSNWIRKVKEKNVSRLFDKVLRKIERQKQRREHIRGAGLYNPGNLCYCNAALAALVPLLSMRESLKKRADSLKTHVDELKGKTSLRSQEKKVYVQSLSSIQAAKVGSDPDLSTLIGALQQERDLMESAKGLLDEIEEKEGCVLRQGRGALQAFIEQAEAYVKQSSLALSFHDGKQKDAEEFFCFLMSILLPRTSFQVRVNRSVALPRTSSTNCGIPARYIAFPSSSFCFQPLYGRILQAPNARAYSSPYRCSFC